MRACTHISKSSLQLDRKYGHVQSPRELTGRLELKVVNVTAGKLKVRSLLGLAGAVEEHQAVRLVDDEDESPVVDAAIVDAACTGAGHGSMLPGW